MEPMATREFHHKYMVPRDSLIFVFLFTKTSLILSGLLMILEPPLG